jgi:hypothetical protein
MLMRAVIFTIRKGGSEDQAPLCSRRDIDLDLGSPDQTTRPLLIEVDADKEKMYVETTYNGSERSAKRRDI